MSAAATESTAAPAPEVVVPQSAGLAEPTPAATVAEDAPVAATPIVDEAKPEEAAATKEETVAPNTAEVTATPVTSGVLGYKAPGIMTQLRFKKQFFWLGDEAVPAKDLHVFLRGSKPDVANPIAAWASQTGKGLLFSSKDEKKGPIADVVPLYDATYITKEGTQDLAFRTGPKKHQHKFQAATQDERNGWLVAITAAHEEAKASKETIEGSDAYKTSLKELKEPSKAVNGVAAGAAAGGAAAAGAGAVAASKESKEETPKEAEATKETPKEAEAKEAAPKKDAKERSQSRKRASIFAGFGKKKEEKPAAEEKAAETKEEAKPEEIKEEAAKPEETKTEGEAAAAVAGTGAIAAGSAAAADHAKETDKIAAEKTAEPKEGEKSATGSAERTKSKRKSGLFGLFDKKVASPVEKEAKKVEEKVVDAFKDDPVAAPDHKEESAVKKAEEKVVEAFKDDPVAPEASKEASTPAEAAKETATTPVGEKRRSSFFGLASKFGSVRNKAPKEAEKKEEKPEAVAEAKAEDAVASPAAAADETKAAPAEAPKEAPKSIGDVVPEAVSVGTEQPVNGAATAPVVTTSA